MPIVRPLKPNIKTSHFFFWICTSCFYMFTKNGTATIYIALARVTCASLRHHASDRSCETESLFCGAKKFAGRSGLSSLRPHVIACLRAVTSSASLDRLSGDAREQLRHRGRGNGLVDDVLHAGVRALLDEVVVDVESRHRDDARRRDARIRAAQRVLADPARGAPPVAPPIMRSMSTRR